MLPNTASEVVYTVKDGMTTISTHTLTVTNLSHPWNMVFFNQPVDISLGGKKRSNFRGFDAILSHDWPDIRNDETDILGLFNALKGVVDNDYTIEFNVSGDTNKLTVVPTEGTYEQLYQGQIKRTPTRMVFEIGQYKDTIAYD